jgi:hypothetical protein
MVPAARGTPEARSATEHSKLLLRTCRRERDNRDIDA